jgi:putative CocE/NonD family hydrolase
MAFELREVVTPAPVSDRAEQFMVPMRDGVRLATDVYLPDAPTAHGAVLIRGPYDKSSRYQGFEQMAEIFKDRGLVVVGQDSRGKFRSEGDTLPYATDVEDAYDTVEWITRQSWSNGSVGLFGVSYLGYTVWAGVGSRHPAIKAAVPQGTHVDMATNHVSYLWRQEPAAGLAPDDLLQIWADNVDRYVSVDYTMTPLKAAFDEAIEGIGVRSVALDDYFRRGERGDYVNPYGGSHPYWTTNIPILHWSNWFDHGLGPTGIRDFQHFRRIPGRRDLHYLRADAADHGGVRLDDVPYAEADHPWVNDAEHERVEQGQALDAADFLRPLLRGDGTLPAPDQRVRWYTGHGGWRSSSEWPPPGLVVRRWYLTGADRAVDSTDGGALAVTADAARAVVDWEHDPSDPVPACVTPDEFWTFLAVYPDERESIMRPDVLTFTTDEMNASLDMCGAGSLRLRVATSGPSMHVFARLLDLAPDESAHRITQGRVLLIAPDLDRSVQLDLDPVAYRVRAGHRLRLHVSSSEHPIFVRHPGTEENPWTAERLVVNRQQLLLGGMDPAHLELPLYEGDNKVG